MKSYSVYITVKDKKDALKIGAELVSSRLAACANIINNVESVYRWNGKIQSAQEVILIVKTKESAIEKLIEKVKSLHSDECPCIVVWPIVDGNVEYLKWIEKEVK